MHAIEVLKLVKELLITQASRHGETGRGALMTCEYIYRDDTEGWNSAKELLSKLVGADRQSSTCLHSS